MGKILTEFTNKAYWNEGYDIPVCLDDLSQEIGIPCLVGPKGGSYRNTETGARNIMLEFGNISFGRIWEGYPESHHVE